MLVTKIGLDGHDRGSRIVAAACRDAGMEVIYTPPWQSIAAVVKLAMEEDVDVVGISSLATDHLIVPKLMTALREAGLGNVRVVVGGIVPDNEESAAARERRARGVPSGQHDGRHHDPHARVRARGAPRRRRRGEPDMNKPIDPQLLAGAERRRARAGSASTAPTSATTAPIANVSGIPIQPLYSAADRAASGDDDRSAIPASPTTRAASTRPCTAAAPGRSAS